MRHSRARSAATAGISGAWVSLGPLPLPSDASGIGLQDYNWVSGRATTIVIDPNDLSGNTVYAGGAYGGVWKSTNAGNLSPSPVTVNWTPLTDNQATLAIGAIAVQKQIANPNLANSVVLAGTGETNSSGDSYYGLGILRSADGGQSWALIAQTQPARPLFPVWASANSPSARAIPIWSSPPRDRLPKESWKAWRIRSRLIAGFMIPPTLASTGKQPT